MYTKKAVTVKANMTQATCAQIEKSAKPGHASLKKIAKAMGLNPEQLDSCSSCDQKASVKSNASRLQSVVKSGN